MSEMTNNPNDKVRELQRQLWMCAKRSRARRFHALYDRICRSDVLREAWKRVKKNRGSAGVDEVTLKSIEEYGVSRVLGEIQAHLWANPYPPQPGKRRYIPKGNGEQGTRPMGIPPVWGRVVQLGAKLFIRPIFWGD